ncbi:hypothetical protein TNCV_1030151 [Trichonephila clavipes]|nr:hypothetical protein TNCV_1030151 [Trichonephila clavipes]
MACDTEDCGFQMLNDDEIVTSVQEESDDETHEDDDNNNNESSENPSNVDAFSTLETAMEWYEHQPECCPTQLTAAQENQRHCIKKTKCPVSYTAWMAFGFRLSEQLRIRMVSDSN